MGTPEFAATILIGLLENHLKVVAVFTNPDRPKNRGHKITQPPTKIIAQLSKIPVFQPGKLCESTVLQEIEKLNPDVIVVAAYGQIIPKEILTIPKYGCINVHASLLPKYRGGAPIQWTLHNGEKKTGISIILLEEQLDAGPIICQCEIKIEPEATAKTLFATLAELGKQELIRALSLIQESDFVAQKQQESAATFAPLLKKEMAFLDFNQEAQKIVNKIRAFNIWPVARANFNEKTAKITNAKVILNKFSLSPGELLNKKGTFVGCKEGAIEFTEFVWI
jgi:methionyl-tRNA formyltransferase